MSVAIVWIFTITAREAPLPPLRLWCVLRRAIPGGRISTLCCAGDGLGERSYEPALVSTQHPAEFACPACERHLAVTTDGAAVAVEPEIAIDQRPTAEMRRRVVGVDEIEDWGDP